LHNILYHFIIKLFYVLLFIFVYKFTLEIIAPYFYSVLYWIFPSLFTFQYHKELQKILSGELSRQLMLGAKTLAEKWTRFVSRDVDRGHGSRPRWANGGLNFLVFVCQPGFTCDLSLDEFTVNFWVVFLVFTVFPYFGLLHCDIFVSYCFLELEKTGKNQLYGLQRIFFVISLVYNCFPYFRYYIVKDFWCLQQIII